MSDVDEDPQHRQHQAVDDVAGRLFVIWTVDGIHGKAFLTQIKGPEVKHLPVHSLFFFDLLISV